MSAVRRAAALLGLGAPALAAALVSAQSTLRDRIERGGDGVVELRYAARADVCGSGPAIQIGANTYIQRSGGSWGGLERELCRRGPVVVRITRNGGYVVGIDVGIGSAGSAAAATDLGAVSGQAAAEYFLDLAARAEGRPAREALLPAVLADSAPVAQGLLRLARNPNLSRSVRQGALSWVAREIERVDAEEGRRLSAAVVAIASDPAEAQPVRQQAVSVLARTERADLAALTRMAGGGDPWLRQAAVQALASSGDPRGREFLRSALRDPALPEALRPTVIRGLGREYATPRDAELLRGSYAGLGSAASRSAVLSVLGELGGSANLDWLLALAASPDTPAEHRAQAIEAAARAGAATAQLGRLYEDAPDRRSKEGVISALVRRGDRASLDRLIEIARKETDPQVRRSLISRLGRTEDERVKQLLKELVGQ